jgi:Ca-activated chloride channel homolog
MSFLTPLAFVGAALAIPIILMYMLRLRRREVVVSSTFLWQQLLKDNEANTPWQRLKRNLLLFLQLLILLALIFALARPFITVPAVGTGQIVLLLDASASMNATDINGTSRFEDAKRQALGEVDTMSASNTMTVIRVTDVPEVIATSTNDPLALRTAISDAKPSQARADWSGALTLAIGSSVGATDFNVVIISDGGLGDPALLPNVPGKVTYLPVGQSSSNIAVTALATSVLPGKSPQLFTQITNYGDEEAEVVFSLSIDATLTASDFYTIPPHDNVSLVYESLPDNFAIIEATVIPSSGSQTSDYLAEDNTAWAISSGAANRRVLLMTSGNLFVEQVLSSLPSIEAFKGDLVRGLPSQAFDLYVLDGWLPAALPEGDVLIINPPRSTDLFTVGAENTVTTNPLVLASDPRMTFVDFQDVNVLSFREISDADWATPLINVDGGPLLLAGEIDGRQIAILTFDLHNSDLPLQITWPVLMSNLLNWYSPQSIISVPTGLSVGESLMISPPLTADTLQITLPDGLERTIPIDRQSIIYADTSLTGIYTLDVIKDEIVQQSQPFVVNLFEPQESDITPLPITLGGTVIPPGEREDVGQLEFWSLAALLGLLILLIEWYVYHQRLRTPTIMRPVTRRANV